MRDDTLHVPHPTPSGVDPAPTDGVIAALNAASRACRQVAIDYQSGLLDDEEMTRSIIRCGVVILADEVWLFDTETTLWWRYRGAEPVPMQISTDGGE